MPIIRGNIAPRVSSVKLLQSWQHRRGSEISPQADLEISGDSFKITYSSSWAIESLKHSFDIEARRVEPRALVNWL